VASEAYGTGLLTELLLKMAPHGEPGVACVVTCRKMALVTESSTV
jgi:hypothetical protein